LPLEAAAMEAGWSTQGCGGSRTSRLSHRQEDRLQQWELHMAQ
jgi:hypothetical protein